MDIAEQHAAVSCSTPVMLMCRRSGVSDEDILWCLYSISDNNSYLLFNRDPIDRMMKYFTSYFKPDTYQQGYSLAIMGGRGGARLTHTHERYGSYVTQFSLCDG